MSTDRTRLMTGSTPVCSGSPLKYENLETTVIHHEQTLKSAADWLFAIQTILVVLFAVAAKETFLENNKFADAYQAFTGIEIMMLIGVGYLMSFLQHYGMGALGFTLLITVVGLQWGILTEAFATQWFNGTSETIPVNITTLVTGLHLVASLLISFGAVIGKASPLQLVVLVVFECVFYAINKVVFLNGYLEAIDAGGTIGIHLFGAYFGLAVAYLLGAPSKSTEGENNVVSDTFALVGTLFLWIYWPTFNGATLEPNTPMHQRAIVGTVLSLCAATVGTFFASSYLNPTHKFRPVDVQNATLAGGVAIGAVCNLTLSLADCLLISFIAGVVATMGYAYLQAKLENAGVHDTCGVHNRHGLPAIVGGLASVVLCYIKAQRGHDMPTVFHHRDQASLQLMALILTLFFAILTGAATGLVMRCAAPTTTAPYTDAPYWEVSETEGTEYAESPLPRELFAQDTQHQKHDHHQHRDISPGKGQPYDPHYSPYGATYSSTHNNSGLGLYPPRPQTRSQPSQGHGQGLGQGLGQGQGQGQGHHFHLGVEMVHGANKGGNKVYH